MNIDIQAHMITLKTESGNDYTFGAWQDYPTEEDIAKLLLQQIPDEFEGVDTSMVGEGGGAVAMDEALLYPEVCNFSVKGNIDEDLV